MGNKIKTLLMSCVIMTLCAAMIVAGTFALWSDSVKVENHLTAGTMSVKLERISLTKTYLNNETGKMATTTNTTIVDFSNTNTSNANVFDIANDEKVVPSSAYEATLKLSNNGDVAFSYDVIIKLNSNNNALAEQLEIYVDGTSKGMLSDFAVDGKAVISKQEMLKNDSAKEFTVKVVFVNDDDVNNDAQNKEVKFDLMVNAVQLT